MLSSTPRALHSPFLEAHFPCQRYRAIACDLVITELWAGLSAHEIYGGKLCKSYSLLALRHFDVLQVLLHLCSSSAMQIDQNHTEGYILVIRTERMIAIIDT